MTRMTKAILLGSAGCALALAAPAAAQVAEEPDAPASEATPGPVPPPIIVTATKSNATLEDTAGAVTVLGGDAIGAGGIENVSDLSSAVPNVSVGDQFGVNRTFIRGIGMTSIDLGADGAVAFLQNGAIIGRPAAQLTGFYDLSQVEILRGPQGTTYGRGATAGVINLVTARPTPDFEGYGRFTYGNYDAITVEGAVGGPVTNDVMFRVSGKFENRDGYGVNLFTGDDIDDRDAYALRGSLLFEPSPDLEILLVGDYFREDDFNYAFHFFGPTVVPDPFLPGPALGGQTIFDVAAARGEQPDLRNIYSNEDAINDREGYSGQAVITWNPGDLIITSTTAYRQFERFNRADLDVTDVWAFGRIDYLEDSDSFSQELTFAYDDGPLSLLGGAMYYTEDLFGIVRVPLVNLAGFLNVVSGTNLPPDLFDNGEFLQRGTVETDAFGVYGEVTYEVAPRLSLTAGARYNYEKRVGEGSFTFDAFGTDISTDREASWDSVTPKFAIEYRTPGGTLFYGKVTRGFKSGVINIGSVNPVIDPESVWSYEIGARGETVDRTFGFGAAAFYYDYTDLQVSFVNENSIVETVNAASARNWGVELETTVRPADNLVFRFFGTYLDATFTDFCNGYYAAGDPTRRQFPACPTNPAISDLSGNRLPNAPEFSFAAFADYTIELGASGNIDLSADLNFQDEVFFNEFNNRDAREGAFTLVNASITYRSPDDRWSVALWGRNLTDSFALANTIITAPLYGFVSVGSLRPPRTYGVTLGVDF